MDRDANTFERNEGPAHAVRDAATASADAAPSDAGTSVGCGEGAPKPLTRVRFVPAPGQAAKMVGGRFQGSNLSATNGFVDLATITSMPKEGSYNELSFENGERYRFVKYYSPDASYGAVAELAFYAGGERLVGASFGSAGSRDDSGRTYERALDGDLESYFEGAIPDGNYVGIDVGQGALVEAPVMSPLGGAFDAAPLQVSLSSATPSASIRYTTDGSNPSRDHGTLWSGPVELPLGSTQLKAIAYSECLFDSPVVSQSYAVGLSEPVSKGQKSYHIGNSLTDTINPWLEPIADSTGVDHVYARWTIPGAGPRWLWQHKGDGFADPEGANQFDTFVKTFAPIDHISVQPFSDNTFSTHGQDARAMFAAARVYSPDVQFWIYAQWPSLNTWSNDGLARGAEYEAPPSEYPPPAQNWEEATLHQERFHERFRAYVDEAVDGKPVLVIPAGRALVMLKRAIEAGQVPGIGDFVGAHFSDDLHLSDKGAYLVSLVFYACLYRQNPEGRVTYAGTGLTEAQARLYQRIAWDAVEDYPWGGVAKLPE